VTLLTIATSIMSRSSPQFIPSPGRRLTLSGHFEPTPQPIEMRMRNAAFVLKPTDYCGSRPGAKISLPPTFPRPPVHRVWPRSAGLFSDSRDCIGDVVDYCHFYDVQIEPAIHPLFRPSIRKHAGLSFRVVYTNSAG
jgi:hypothetical protein